MKTINIFLATFAILFTTDAFSQGKNLKSVETEFKVAGVCKMCKERIEEAAIYAKGVKFAEWTKETQILKVVYNGKKTDEKTIHERIAKAGHDTEKVTAKNEDYLKIPDCCRYRDGVAVH